MSPDGLPAVVILVALAALAAGATALVWDRPRGWAAWAVRPVAVLLCLASAAGAAVVTANHLLGFYGSWRELAGLGAPDASSGSIAVVSVSGSGSKVIAFQVRGRASGLTLRAYAYLPPGYDGALSGDQLPVLEVLDGFPGSPHVWLSALDAPRILDREITSGRMAPTVVVFPYQSPSSAHDTECVDAVGGLAVDTFLSVDVPAAVLREFRVRPDRAGWALMGYSTGGYCAVNLALRHPARFAAAASLSGNLDAITDATTGDLYRGDTAVRNQNDPLWRVAHLPPVPVALYLATGLNDRTALIDIRRFVALARPPLRVSTAAIPRTGHTEAAWRAMEAPAYDWLSSWLARPEPSSGVSR